MRTSGPLLTLLAAVGLAIGLLAVNMAAHPAPVAAPAPAAAASAAPPTFPQLAGYSGRTSGRALGEATVQLAVGQGAAVAYISDGKKLASWLRGQVTGDAVTLRGTGTDVLTGTLTGGSTGTTVNGDVTLSGKHWRFAAEPGAAPAAQRRLAAGAGTSSGSGTSRPGTSGSGKAKTPPTTAPDPYTSPGASSTHHSDTAQAAGAGGW